MTIQEQLAAELKELAETTPARGGTTRSGLLQAAGYVGTWAPTEGARIPDSAIVQLDEHVIARADALDWIVGYLDETAGNWGLPNHVLAEIAKHLIDSGFATAEGGIFRAVER